MKLRCENVTQIYNVNDQVYTVLENVCFQVHSGEFSAITGRSGIGKSTLLKILGTLQHPTKGSVLYDERNIYEMTSASLAYMRNQSIGFVYQDFQLLPYLSVKENILLPDMIADCETEIAYFDCLTQALEINDFLNYMPHMLSGGQQQRTALARALIHKPDIIFADEPSGSLDEASAVNFMQMLRELQKVRSFSAVIVTHDKCIFDYVDSVWELKQHRSVCDGYPDRTPASIFPVI